MKKTNILTYLLLPISLAISSPLLADNSKDNQMEELQHHWQMILSEKDANKRKEMINVHKSMMMNIEKTNSIHHMDNMSDNHMGMSNMMEMNNIIDMQRSMIKMME